MEPSEALGVVAEDASKRNGDERPEEAGEKIAGEKKPFVLFARYVPLNTTMEELKAPFEQFGEVLPSTVLMANRRIAFIHFAKEDALAAAEAGRIRIRNSNLQLKRAWSPTRRGKEDRGPRDELRQPSSSKGTMIGDMHQSNVSGNLSETELSNGDSVGVATFTSEDLSSETRPRSEQGSISSLPLSRSDSPTPTLLGPPAPVKSLRLKAIPDDLSIEDIQAWIGQTPESSRGKFRLVRTLSAQGLRQGFIDYLSSEDARKALAFLRSCKIRERFIPIEIARDTRPVVSRTTPSHSQSSFASSQKLNDGSVGASPLNKRADRPRTQAKQLYRVRLPTIPPGATREELRKGYIKFGQIRDITLKNLDLNTGHLAGESFSVAPDEPKQMLASLRFVDVASARKAAAAGSTDEVEGLEVIRDGDSSVVIVGPFSPDIQLSHISRLMSKFGQLSGARVVKKTTACILTFENEKAAQRACEIPVLVRGMSLLGVREDY